MSITLIDPFGTSRKVRKETKYKTPHLWARFHWINQFIVSQIKPTFLPGSCTSLGTTLLKNITTSIQQFLLARVSSALETNHYLFIQYIVRGEFNVERFSNNIVPSKRICRNVQLVLPIVRKVTTVLKKRHTEERRPYDTNGASGFIGRINDWPFFWKERRNL